MKHVAIPLTGSAATIDRNGLSQNQATTKAALLRPFFSTLSTHTLAGSHSNRLVTFVLRAFREKLSYPLQSYISTEFSSGIQHYGRCHGRDNLGSRWWCGESWPATEEVLL